MRNKKKLTAYSVTQCALYKCKSKKRLAKLLFMSLNDLNSLIYDIDNCYYYFTMNKDGSNEKRGITAPKEKLKKIQKRILYLLQRIEKPEWVISSSFGKSYITNAQYHLNSKFICKTDIKQFYDNCTRDRVYRFFKDKLLTSSDVAKIITDLTTRDNIPTGSPSSQLIAYFAYEEMFKGINTIAKNYGCSMTMYVDDLVFSNESDFKHQTLSRDVDIEVRKYKHKLKTKKTRYYSTKNGAPVTGVIVKRYKLHIPNSARKDVINGFSKIKKYQDVSEKELASMTGKVNATRLIEKDHFNGIKSYLKTAYN